MKPSRAPEKGTPTCDTVNEDGLLVGWSLEHKNKTKSSNPVGFIHNTEKIEEPERLEPVLYNGAGHLMTIASTGSGKGTGCIIPALLRHKGPVVVIDPKGENYAITARARREMGQKIILLDPFEITGAARQDYFNPLSMIINFKNGQIEQCKMLAQMIVIQNPYNRDPFWDKSAEKLITGLLLYIAESCPPALQNLYELRYMLNQSMKEMDFTLQQMMKAKNPETNMVASSITGAEPKVRASIISTAQYHIDFMAGDLIAGATHRTSFDLDDIINSKPLSIYIVIPPDKIDTCSKLIRLWIGSLLNLVMMRKRIPDQRTLFILDEAAQLGHLKPLSKAITLLRGYGLQTWSFWQDISQLSSLYPDWETLYNNCQIHQDFGITNTRFARQAAYITGYPHYKEILKLDNNKMILQMAGEEAVIAQRPDYLKDVLFKGMADPNPYHIKENKNNSGSQSDKHSYQQQNTVKKDPAIKEIETALISTLIKLNNEQSKYNELKKEFDELKEEVKKNPWIKPKTRTKEKSKPNTQARHRSIEELIDLAEAYRKKEKNNKTKE